MIHFIKYYLFFPAIFIFAITLDTRLCNAQVVNIPDINFKNTLIGFGYDTNKDGQIQESEAAALTELNVVGRKIFSMKGIESFINLKLLYCGGNEISTIDLSKNLNLINLYIPYNNLSSIDVSNNTLLEILEINYNKLESLDISKNIHLTKLECRNNSLINLSTTNLKSLAILECSYNKIKNVDLSQNNLLTKFNCTNNQISTLDLSFNPELIYFDCSYNLLSSIDVSNNTKLEYLTSEYNHIGAIDLSKNTSITNIRLAGNGLKKLDLSNTIVFSLNCDNNIIESLDLSKNVYLGWVSCVGNKLHELLLPKGNVLLNFNCSSNLLTSLDVSQNPNLGIGKGGYFNCTRNPFLPFICVANIKQANSNYYFIKDSSASWSENCQVTNTTGLHLTREIKVYPNPVQSNLQIENSVAGKLYDIKGIEIYSDINSTLNFQGLNPGTYNLHLTDFQGSTINVKVVKE